MPSFNVAEVEVRTVQRKTRSKVSSLPLLFLWSTCGKLPFFLFRGGGGGEGKEEIRVALLAWALGGVPPSNGFSRVV